MFHSIEMIFDILLVVLKSTERTAGTKNNNTQYSNVVPTLVVTEPEDA